MERTYTILGMTCAGCASSVTEKLLKVKGVEKVEVNLEKGEAGIQMDSHIPLTDFETALPVKYSIQQIEGKTLKSHRIAGGEKTKMQQLKPLFLIFGYLIGTSFLLNVDHWSTNSAMLDFMGLFYIVFSFFKFLDLKGFPESFKMYDPLAKTVPAYGWVYPFLELGLGLMFLIRFQIQIALVATIVILGTTTFGVAKTLLDKKSIRCACLGTALQLPMTEATFIENTIMLVMALFMLAQYL